MRALIRIALAITILLVGSALAVSWLVLTPETVDTYVFEPVEERTGIRISLQRVGLGLDGVTLGEVTVSDPGAEKAHLLRVERVAIRPAWRPLLGGRVEIHYIGLDGIRLHVRQNAQGETNLDRLVDALSSEEEPPPPDASGTTETKTAALRVDRVRVENAKIDYTDEFERPGKPLHLVLEIAHLSMTDLVSPDPIGFDLDGSVQLGSDTRSTIVASGTIATSPVTIDAALKLSEVDVDTLVPNVVKPGTSPPPGPLPLEGLTIDAELEVARVRYEGFEFSGVGGTARLEGPDLAVPRLQAKIAGGTVTVSANIDFGVQGFRYSGNAELRKVDLARAGGLLKDIRWGRHSAPRADADVRLSMAGSEREELLDTIDLSSTVTVDALDLNAILSGADSDRGKDLGPYDTGDGKMAVSLSVETVRVDPFDLTGVQAEASLSHGQLDVAPLDAQIAAGKLTVETHVDLTQPGLLYSGAVTLDNSQIGDLFAPLPKAQWGTRSGVFGGHVEIHGAGTAAPALWKKLSADGEIGWTDGRVTDSEYLRDVSKLTGIPGFRDLVVMNSGGRFKIRNGVFSTKRMRIWGPDAGIQIAGTIDHDLQVDATVALGIGPDSSRKLFSTGIALPYVRGDQGWRFVPINVRGTVADPKMTLPPRAVLESALTAVPAAGVGVVTRTGDLLSGGADAVARGTEAVVPGAPGRVVGGALRGSVGLVAKGGHAVGSVVDGIGGLFGGRTEKKFSTADVDDGDDESPGKPRW